MCDHMYRLLVSTSARPAGFALYTIPSSVQRGYGASVATEIYIRSFYDYTTYDAEMDRKAHH